MDLCMDISANEPYWDENLVSLKESVEEQRLRLTILFETRWLNPDRVNYSRFI